mmetsp:Transcript_23987/g.45573  ORF Transcript_23987/g.45573 Transcript_23987/m.45573 type:complete len:205 (-) Transcript_23987:2432-3046(-)
MSILSVCTETFLMGVWVCTQVYLLNSRCADTAWNTLARFIAYGGGACTLNSYHPLMSMVRTCTGLDGMLEDRLVVSIYNSNIDGRGVMYGVVYGPRHDGGRYRDVAVSMARFVDLDTPMTPTVQMPKVLNATSGQVVPQNSKQVRNVPEAEHWLAAEEEELQSIHTNKVISHTTRSKYVLHFTCMCTKWSCEKVIAKKSDLLEA